MADRELTDEEILGTFERMAQTLDNIAAVLERLDQKIDAKCATEDRGGGGGG